MSEDPKADERRKASERHVDKYVWQPEDVVWDRKPRTRPADEQAPEDDGVELARGDRLESAVKLEALGIEVDFVAMAAGLDRDLGR